MTHGSHRRRWPRRAAAGLATACLAWILAAAPLHAAADAGAFDIVAASPPRLLGADYFGTHLHRLRVPPALRGRELQTPWPEGQVGALRLWDTRTRWADIEPAPGRFEFEQLDHYVTQARAQGASVMLVLGSTPRWASARPWERCPYGSGCLAEPSDLRDWERYVEAVAHRYKGRIAMYELWNEPYFSDFPKDRGHPGAFFSGSADTMVEMARIARAVLDRVDPAAVLLTPGFTGPTHRLELFLSRGGARHVGGVAHHYYAGSDRDFVDVHRQVRAVMERHGLGDLPLYNTESGYERVSPATAGLPPLGVERLDEVTMAAQLASSLVLGAFLGVRGYYQFAWDNTRMGLLQADGRSPTAGLLAYVNVRRWLVGAQLEGCASFEQGLVRCRLQRGEAQVSVLWRPGARATTAFALPAGLEVLGVEDAIAGPVAPIARTLDVGAVPLAVQTRAAWVLPRGRTGDGR